jgi:predicted nuclease with TOPRIM domain
MEILLRLLQIHGDRHLLFIEFWNIIERSLPSSRSEHPKTPGNDFNCLQLLRDRILTELQSQADSPLPQISHTRLLAILREVRDAATDKATWDDAIHSSNLGDGRTHSITAISSAIKVMLEDYVSSVDSPIVNPLVSPGHEKHHELQSEVDDLKSKLTKAVCEVARLKEKESRDHGTVADTSKMKSDIQRLNSDLACSNELLLMKDAQMGELLKTISLRERENDELKKEVKRLGEEIKSLSDRIAHFEIPHSFDLDRRPTMDEWRATLERLEYLQSHFGDEKSDLLSQIQTLEVQKNDVETELTRVLNASTRASSAMGSPVIAGRKFSNAISIYNTQPSTRRSSIASQFVDLAPRTRTVVRMEDWKPPQRKKTSHSRDSGCVQQ